LPDAVWNGSDWRIREARIAVLGEVGWSDDHFNPGHLSDQMVANYKEQLTPAVPIWEIAGHRSASGRRNSA
jgi:hypothetical protein